MDARVKPAHDEKLRSLRSRLCGSVWRMPHRVRDASNLLRSLSFI